MSRLVYLVFLLAVAKASRNTLQQKTEVDAGKPKLAGIIVKASRKTLPQNTKVDAKKESKLEVTIKLPRNVTIPGVIAFGDSIVDSGNNNNLRTILKCNFPPYGQDFQGKFATGRFTDGRVPSDFVAERLGIAKTIPAYLDPALKGKDLLKGINFASGGSGYDPLTAKIVRVVSLEDQLKYFQEYKEKIKAIVGEEKAKFMVENSLYLVVASSNDLAHTYIARSLRYNSTEYPDYLADMSSKFVKKLYGLGARRIAIFSAVPVGCLPSRRTLNGVKRKCSENLNKMALQFNAKLSPGLVALRKKSPGSKIVFVDVYDILHNMIENPKKYGFEVANRGCGTGLFEVLILCNKINPFTCKNASSHVFWDSYHPTEKAYQVIVDKLLGIYIPQLV
ncbi:PREDICTED: GDSL esterase/lipase At5g42170 isoform X1 [Brassica oleracea var. oleracea]|uniref:Uncharacterized protein n=1 Tax=Brassica oleracea var. oleracea TaxID=109376 RepID=A0A0D3ATM2_BRAOL|nr:PREDICTED: GDSL esterase/lipase At5g42170 isoform X1 [Brassica oleracea var. oleracea]